MNALTNRDLIQLIRHLAGVMQAEKDRLTELDAQMGDGDLGVTLAGGFQAMADASTAWEGLSCSEILRESGTTIASAAGTIGTLLSFAFLNAARVSTEKTGLGPVDIPLLLSAAVDSIQKRGRAQPGQKTMLDALVPATEAARKAVQQGRPLDEVLAACAQAASQGAEATRQMVSTQGRGRWFQQRSIGLVDPGAVAIATLLQACADYVRA